jgi:hypothetical protein
MSSQTISLSNVSSSSPFTALPYATGSVGTSIYPSHQVFGIDLSFSDATNIVYVDEAYFPEALHTMLASEKVLARDWNQPDEDEAWENL